MNFANDKPTAQRREKKWLFFISVWPAEYELEKGNERK